MTRSSSRRGRRLLDEDPALVGQVASAGDEPGPRKPLEQGRERAGLQA
jgi:hypothetical protein